MLLEEALEKQRNAMMDNFSQILQRIPTGGASTSNNHSGGDTPFKVQVNCVETEKMKEAMVGVQVE
jgi:hypothetical protein